MTIKLTATMESEEESEKDYTFILEPTSVKVAKSMKEQLTKQGYNVTIEQVKVID